jgi:hypothetical protein
MLHLFISVAQQLAEDALFNAVTTTGLPTATVGIPTLWQ